MAEASIERDPMILEAAVELSAILLTGDGTLPAAAQAMQVFTLAP